MALKLTGLSFAALLCACASVHQKPYVTELKPIPGQPRMFLGHDQTGMVVVAANYHDAMNGLAVPAKELLADAADGDDLFCTRELPTGTHVPRWICRYQAEADHDRMLTQNILVSPRISPSSPAGQATFMVVGPGIGGGPRQGSALPR